MSGIGKGAFSETQIDSRPLTDSFVVSGDSNRRENKNQNNGQKFSQERRDRSHGLVTGSPQIESDYRNVLLLHTVHLRPNRQKNLLIPAYMAAELAQIDFCKIAAEIFKTHRRLSHCEEKTPRKKIKKNNKKKTIPLTHLSD